MAKPNGHRRCQQHFNFANHKKDAPMIGSQHRKKERHQPYVCRTREGTFFFLDSGLADDGFFFYGAAWMKTFLTNSAGEACIIIITHPPSSSNNQGVSLVARRHR